MPEILPFRNPRIPEPATSGQELKEWIQLAVFLANRKVSRDLNPDRWQIEYRQLLEGIIAFHCAPVQPGGAA